MVSLPICSDQRRNELVRNLGPQPKATSDDIKDMNDIFTMAQIMYAPLLDGCTFSMTNGSIPLYKIQLRKFIADRAQLWKHCRPDLAKNWTWYQM